MNARIPPTMAVIEIPAPGGPEVLRLTRRTTPVPGPGEALIQVAAAGVNRLDVMHRQGRYPAPPGAERAINYRTEDFVQVVRDLTSGGGVNVILDMVGGDYFARNIDVLAVEGRLVQIAFLRGAKVEIDLLAITQRRLTITGSTLRSRNVAEKGAIARAVHKEVWPLIESGQVTPVIHATFPLAQAAEAHRLVESGSHICKIILQVH